MDKIGNLQPGDSVYIAGKMRGEPSMNFCEFFYWEKILRDSLYSPVNPASMDIARWEAGEVYKDCHYPDILLADLRAIMNVDAMFMLKSWKDSPGARAEHAFAEAIGKQIFYEEEAK